MKLLLKFGGFDNYEKQFTVEWNDVLANFPKWAKYDSRFWGWIFQDADKHGDVDYVLWFGEHRQTAMPIDMFGNPFPISDIETMFNLNANVIAAKCECGTDSYGAGNHSRWCPKWTN